MGHLDTLLHQMFANDILRSLLVPLSIRNQAKLQSKSLTACSRGRLLAEYTKPVTQDVEIQCSKLGHIMYYFMGSTC